MKEARKTLLRVIALIWALAAVVAIVGVILHVTISISLVPYILGILLGSLVSSLLMWHRYTTIDVEVDMSEKGAVNHSRAMATLRTIICLATLFVAFRFPVWVSPVTVFIGLFATKVAALLYPIMYK